MSVEIITFKKLGFLPVYLASFFFSSTPLDEQCSNLSLENPTWWIAVRTVHNGDKKSSVLLVWNTEIKCRRRPGRGRMPRLEPRQSSEKPSIQYAEYTVRLQWSSAFPRMCSSAACWVRFRFKRWEHRRSFKLFTWVLGLTFAFFLTCTHSHDCTTK